MTQNQKIAIGLGALALGYWLYTKNKEKKSAEAPSSPQSPSAPTTTGNIPPIVNDFPKLPTITNSCKGENEVPCNNGSGKCYMINARYKTDPCKVEGKVHGMSDDYKFEVLENFTAEYFNNTTGKWANANFNKGQIINAKPIPMGNTSGLATTPDGKYPNLGLIGGNSVNVPISKLKRIYN